MLWRTDSVWGNDVTDVEMKRLYRAAVGVVWRSTVE